MSSNSATVAKKPRGRPPKPMPRIEASPEQIAHAVFSDVKSPDLSVRIQKSGTRKRKSIC